MNLITIAFFHIIISSIIIFSLYSSHFRDIIIRKTQLRSNLRTDETFCRSTFIYNYAVFLVPIISWSFVIIRIIWKLYKRDSVRSSPARLGKSRKHEFRASLRKIVANECALFPLLSRRFWIVDGCCNSTVSGPFCVS